MCCSHHIALARLPDGEAHHYMMNVEGFDCAAVSESVQHPRHGNDVATGMYAMRADGWLLLYYYRYCTMDVSPPDADPVVGGGCAWILLFLPHAGTTVLLPWEKPRWVMQTCWETLRQLCTLAISRVSRKAEAAVFSSSRGAYSRTTNKMGSTTTCTPLLM